MCEPVIFVVVAQYGRGILSVTQRSDVPVQSLDQVFNMERLRWFGYAFRMSSERLRVMVGRWVELSIS